MPKRRGVFRTKHKIGKGKSVYAQRKKTGRFHNIQSIRKAMAKDRTQKAKRKVKSGYGFRGDTK